MTKRHAQNPLTLKLLNLFGQFTISTSLQLCKFLAMLEAHSCSFEAWTLFQDGFPILWPTFDQFVTNIWPILWQIWPILWPTFDQFCDQHLTNFVTNIVNGFCPKMASILTRTKIIHCGDFRAQTASQAVPSSVYQSIFISLPVNLSIFISLPVNLSIFNPLVMKQRCMTFSDVYTLSDVRTDSCISILRVRGLESGVPNICACVGICGVWYQIVKFIIKMHRKVV